MKVKVTLGGSLSPSGADDIQITADATVTCGDVAEALAHSDRRKGQWAPGRPLTLRILSSAGGSLALPADRTLVESGITSGSTVEIAFAADAAADRAQQATAAVLHVMSGPDAGKQFALPVGSSTVGRFEDNDVKLSDPLVSKHHCRIVVGPKVELIDAGSANGVVVGGVRTSRVALASGELAELGDTRVSIVPVRTAMDATSTDVAYVRPPRVLTRPVAEDIDLPDVPSAPQHSRFPWLALVAPLLMGSVLLLSQHSLSSSALLPLSFIAMSPLLMLGNYVDQRVQRARRHREDLAGFEAGLSARETELHDAQQRERAQLLTVHPSLAECVDAVTSRGGVLWSRRPEHPEFLQVRLGLGDIKPLHSAVPPRPHGIPELLTRAVAVADAYSILTDSPVVADLRSVGGLGLCGSSRQAEGAARALVAQVAALHSPAEVVVACLTSTRERARWEWLQWLPHTSSPHSPLAGPHLAAEPGTGKLVLNRLEELIDARSNGAAATPRGPVGRDEKPDVPTVPSVLVVIDGTSVDVARLNRIAENGPDVGVYVLWVAEEVAALPAACRTYVAVQDHGGATVGMVRRGRSVQGVRCDAMETQVAMAFARRMAPMFDAGSPVDDQSDLPRNVSMVSLVGHEATDDAAVVLGRWRENQSLVPRDGRPPVSRERAGDLVAVVGHAGSEQFTLDLRTQGPHALVGGTTGAGKSEFLQAWVLGLAHAYSPDRVTFLFVDYKGGAAFAKCVDLPHTVGLVTDLSPYLVARALRSLRAELRHREHLLNRLGKTDLLELEKTGDPDCPPSLIIVVDEFAALANEVPEFVNGVVDVAQRGRSLGLHLVLATQRPAGVIKDNLRANTNLRIALRMADESDSHDVLGDHMAAHFPASIPGRGAAKTGPGRITKFQSAFPGARTSQDSEAPPIEVVDLDFGPAKAWKMPQRERPAVQVDKDIDRLVTSIAAAATLGRVPAPRKPWLDSLATTYNLARLSPRRDTKIPIGVLDDPDNQAQVQEYFEPDQNGNIVFFGAGGSGKSTALRTLAVASAITPGGGVTHVYGIDLGGGSLTSLEVMPNVGSIIGGDDEERITRLLSRLTTMAEERAARYSAVAAFTLQEYRIQAAAPDEPRILLLIDGFSAFRNAFESSVAHQRLYGQFQRLLVDGRSVGIHVAMTADRPTAVPNSILAGFRRRVVLRQADDDAYVALGVPKDVLTPASPPGRAMQVDKPQELQLAVFLSTQHAQHDDTSNAAQIKAMEKLAREIDQRFAVRPEPIASLPALVSSSTLPQTIDDKPVLGVWDETLEPIPFAGAGVLLLSGPAQSGRTNALQWLGISLRRWSANLPLVHISARRTPLSSLDLWTMTADNHRDVAQLLTDLEQITSQVSSGDRPLVALFVEYLPEFLGTPVEQQLLATLSACRRNGHLVVAEGEGPSWSAPWPLIMEIRNARTGLLLQPDQPEGDALLRTSLPRAKRADFPPGRGYWVRGGRAQKVQLPLVDAWGEQPIDSHLIVSDGEPTTTATAVEV